VLRRYRCADVRWTNLLIGEFEMLYAQFLTKSAISDVLIEACGDRAVIILDGRYSTATNGEISAKECAKRGYLAWAIYQGATFTRSRKVSGPYRVMAHSPDNSAMSATFGA